MLTINSLEFLIYFHLFPVYWSNNYRMIQLNFIEHTINSNENESKKPHVKSQFHPQSVRKITFDFIWIISQFEKNGKKKNWEKNVLSNCLRSCCSSKPLDLIDSLSDEETVSNVKSNFNANGIQWKHRIRWAIHFHV